VSTNLAGNILLFWSICTNEPFHIVQLDIYSFEALAVSALVSKLLKAEMNLELLRNILSEDPPIPRVAGSIRAINELLSGNARIFHVVEVKKHIFPSFVADQEPIVLVVLEKLQIAGVALGLGTNGGPLAQIGHFRRELT
jgi:hypothetical protein